MGAYRTMKIVFIVGTRPQFIKHAALLPALGRHELVTIHTGQHFDEELSREQFRALGLGEPTNLGIPGGEPTTVLAAMLDPLVTALRKHNPDIVLVYGDTTSTLAGALAARMTGLPLGHVEAGLRCGERDMPEEIARVVTDHVADLLFAPTTQAVTNLYHEGLGERTVLSGDLMYELLAQKLPNVKKEILQELGLKERGYILLTMHRAANTDNPMRLRRILSSVAKAPLPIVFPVHPRTALRIKEAGMSDLLDLFIATPPLVYDQNLALLLHSKVCITDSGGLQKEAFFLGVPCLTLRDRSEWVETLEDGANRCVDDDPESIAAGIANAGPKRRVRDLVGEPPPSVRIAQALEEWWEKIRTARN
jgi:UDP-N-acetylglucosamine 2-epimerase